MILYFNCHSQMPNKLDVLSKKCLGLQITLISLPRQTTSKLYLQYRSSSHAMPMPVCQPKVLVGLAPPKAPPLAGVLCSWPTLNKVLAHKISLLPFMVPSLNWICSNEMALTQPDLHCHFTVVRHLTGSGGPSGSLHTLFTVISLTNTN